MSAPMHIITIKIIIFTGWNQVKIVDRLGIAGIAWIKNNDRYLCPIEGLIQCMTRQLIWLRPGHVVYRLQLTFSLRLLLWFLWSHFFCKFNSVVWPIHNTDMQPGFTEENYSLLFLQTCTVWYVGGIKNSKTKVQIHEEKHSSSKCGIWCVNLSYGTWVTYSCSFIVEWNCWHGWCIW